MEVTVKAKYVKTAPRKLRLVADLVRSWSLEKALLHLKFIPKKPAHDILKVLLSAQAAAKDHNFAMENVIIKALKVDEGPRLKRRLIGSRGRTYAFNRQASHITITLSEVEKKTTQEKSRPETEKVTPKKTTKEPSHGTKS